jgi:BirA family transcriptional regulator, biotin operon repressor / biotin---[acetyl-CoA-carboxylase] ligase
VRGSKLQGHLAGSETQTTKVSANILAPEATARGADGMAPGGGRSRLDWPAEAIRQSLSSLPGFTFEVLPEVDSTNSELMRRTRAGLVEPVLLVAERQSVGRGRLGRAWDSSVGDSLTFSVGLPLMPPDWSGLSLAVGVGLAESLDARIRLKWPNDLWLQDRKLAGILIETAATQLNPQTRYAVIGVGINLAERPPAGLSTAPAWLREVLPGCQPGEVLLRVAGPLVRAVQEFERRGFAAFKSRFDALDLLRDRKVVLSDGTCGTGRGTTGLGGLQVQTADGMKTVVSSEVSVRPAA